MDDTENTWAALLSDINIWKPGVPFIHINGECKLSAECSICLSLELFKIRRPIAGFSANLAAVWVTLNIDICQCLWMIKEMPWVPVYTAMR